MSDGESAAFWARVHGAARAGEGLCSVSPALAARLLGFHDLTVSLQSTKGNLELLWYDPDRSLGAELDDLQCTLGEGPTLDALQLGRIVAEPDLAAVPDDVWPAFLPAVLTTPARAVIAEPLKFGAATVGVLTGYRTTSGAFPIEQRRDLDCFARTVRTLLMHTPADALDATPGPGPRLDLHRAEVHQAIGILSVQLDVPVDEALLRLRAYAFRHDRALLDLARDIIGHRLRLDGSPPDEGG